MMSAQAKAAPTPKAQPRGLFDFLASLPYVLTVLICLGVLGILGTIIPQRPADIPPAMQSLFDENAQKFLGEPFAAMAKLLALDRLFTSWYFLALLIALALSLIVCTWRRLAVVLRRPSTNIPASGTPVDLPPGADALSILRRLGYHPRGSTEHAVADKHRWNLWGSVFIHISLLTFLASGLLTWKFSLTDNVNLTPGPEVYLSDELLPGVTARVSEAAAEKDPNTGSIIEYRTALKVYAAGEEIANDTIRVNHPLDIAGITIYQTNMQDDGLGLGLAARSASQQMDPPTQPDLTVLDGTIFFLGGIPLSIEVMNPHDPTGKMALISVNGKIIPLAAGKSARIATPRGDYDLWYLGPNPTVITGLTLKRPAGMELFWAACLLISLGVIIVFLPFYHRIRLAKDSNGTWLLFLSGRSSLSMDEKMAKILSKIKSLEQK